MSIFKYIKASQFFASYAPGVTQYKHKIRGLSGKSRPIEFNEEDKKTIKTGLKKLSADLQKELLSL